MLEVSNIARAPTPQNPSGFSRASRAIFHLFKKAIIECNLRQPIS